MFETRWTLVRNRRIRRQAIVGVGAGLLLLLPAAPARSVGQNGWTIAAASLDTRGHLLAADGSLSADGRTLAFVSRHCPGGGRPCRDLLFVRDITADRTRSVVFESHVHALGRYKSLAEPVLDSDGRRLAIEETYTGSVYVTDLRTRKWHAIRGAVGGAYRPVFTDDGSFLLLHARKCSPSETGFGVGRYSLATGRITCVRSNLRLKASDDFGSNDLAASGNGRYVVFLARLANAPRRDPLNREYVYDFATRTTSEVKPGASPHASNFGRPSITTDGTEVLVQGDETRDDNALYLSAPNGSPRRIDGLGSGVQYWPSFSPALSGDGNAVAFRGIAGGREALYAQSPLDATPIKIAGLGGSDDSGYTTQLSRDGHRLLFRDRRGRLRIASR